MIKLIDKTEVDKIVCLQQKENFIDGWNKEQLLSSFRSGNFLAIGEFDNGNLVAFITLSLSIDFADLEDILVASEYRKKGIATSLLENAEKLLLQKGIGKIFLEVRENNLSAISFYEKSAFTLLSKRKKYYMDGENALVYQKEI